MYLGNGKKPMENPVIEVSSNNDYRWPEGSVSEKALRRVVVRSNIRTERREPEPLSRHHRKPKTVWEPKRIEANNNMSFTDRTTDEKNYDTVEALKRHVQNLKRKLKKNTQGSCKSKHSSRPKTRSKLSWSLSTQSSDSSASKSKEGESSNGRKQPGRSLGRGSWGNGSEAPMSTRQLYRARRGQDMVWKALHQISNSSFSKEIERAWLLGKFSPPNYVMYEGRADLVGHISHFKQSMALHLNNDALMCRMFPSSLGPVSLRWFNRLEHSLIHSWDEMAEAFILWFITNNQKLKELDSFLSMSMKNSESLKNYSSRYWEVYNEVDGCTEEIAIKTFKLGLDSDFELRQNLTRRPNKSMRDIMSWIEQFVWMEDDRMRKGAVLVQNRPPKKLTHVEPRKPKPPIKSQRHFPQPRNLGGIHTIFNETIYRIMAEIKNEPFFSWLIPLGGDPSRRDQNKYYTYHREKGHITKKCFS